MKKRLTMKDSKLRERNKIENCIKLIKSNCRISDRKDKKIINYMGFVYIAIGRIYDTNKFV